MHLPLQHHPARIIDIDFSCPKRAQKEQFTTPSPPSKKTRVTIPSPNAVEKKSFLTGLRKVCPKAAVLTTVFPQSMTTATKSTESRKLPSTIVSLFHPKYRDLSPRDLSQECSCIFSELKVTEEESKYLAESTSLQSFSPLWHEHRWGRITSSRFGQVCHSNLMSPSKSLVSCIFQQSQFTSAATKWGVDNEDKARQAYKESVLSKHSSFSLLTTGLCINPLYPHL